MLPEGGWWVKYGNLALIFLQHQFLPLLIIAFKYQVTIFKFSQFSNFHNFQIFKFLVWNPYLLNLGDICKFKEIFWTVGNSFLNFTETILSSKTTTFSRDWLCSRSCCSRPSSDCSLSSISTFHNAFFLSLSAFNWSRKSWNSKL